MDSLNITNIPELEQLAEEVHRTNRPRLLRRDGHKLAVVLPVQSANDRPHDIWAGYDPAQVRDALKRSAGALAEIDGEALARDIKQQRGQDSKGRPA